MSQVRASKDPVVGKVFTPGIPIPPGHWYRARLREAVDAFVVARKIRHPGVREICAELAKLGVDANEDRVGRYLAQKAFAVDLVGPVSRVLGIPPFAIIADTEDQARLLDAVPRDGATDDEMFAYYFGGLDSIRKRIEAYDQTATVSSRNVKLGRGRPGVQR